MAISDPTIIVNVIAAIFGLIISLIGLLMLTVSYLLIKGRISRSRNMGIGFRIKEAYASDEAWYHINREGGKLMILPSLAQIACGLFIIYAAFDVPWLLTAVILIAIALAIAGSLILLGYVKRVSQNEIKPPVS